MHQIACSGPRAFPDERGLPEVGLEPLKPVTPEAIENLVFLSFPHLVSDEVIAQ